MVILFRSRKSAAFGRERNRVCRQIAVALVAAGAVSAVPARAQTFTWNGGGANNNWSTGANWGGSAPTANSNIQFNGTTRLTPFLDAAYVINSLTFLSGAGAFTLGGSTLTIGAGGITQSSATNLQTISNTGVILSANQTWTVAAGGLSVSAPVSGAFSLVVTGAGVLTLSGTNLYTGGTTVNSGTLRITSDRGLGAVPGSASTNLTLNAGTLQWGNTFNLNAKRNISLGAGGGTLNTNGYSGTVAGIISGSGSLTKSGTGTLTLTGNNTYTGGTILNGGVLNVSADSRLGAVPGSPTTNLTFNSGTLQWGGAFTLNANRNITLGATGGIFDTNGYAGTVAGVISGTGALTKLGTGTLTLTGANTFSGGTTVSAGTLAISADNALGAIPASPTTNLTLNGGTLLFNSGFTVSTNRTISLGASGGTLDTGANAATIGGVISGSGSLTKLGTGTLTLNGTSTYTGGTFLNAGTVLVSADTGLGAVPGAASTNLTFSGGTLQWGSGFTLHQRRNVTLNSTGGTLDTGANAATVAGVISGTGALTKLGTGTLTLTGSNTYTGGTTVGTSASQGTGGTLALSSDASLGAVPGSASTNLTLNSNTLLFNSGFTLNANRNIALGTGNATFDTGSNSVTVAGVLSGTASLTKAGSGTLILSGTNTYSGGTIFNNGILRVSADNQLGATPGAFSASNLTFNGGTLQLGASFNPGANRGLTLNSGGGTINTNSYSATVSQVITGSGALTKSGTGTLTLTGTNTFTGGTTVSGGTLITGAAGINNSSVLVTSGATIADSDSNGSTGINQAFLNLINNSSAGVVALGFNGTNNNNLSFANLPSLSLGATGTYTYSGTLTPNGTTYRLGGGGGTLTLSSTSLLTGANSLVVGLNGTTGGTVILQASNTYVGGTTVNGGVLSYGSASNVGFVVSTPLTAVVVNSGGTAANNVAISQSFLTTINSGSAGVVALGANSSNALDFSSNVTGANLTAASLGAIGSYTYSGTLTPNGGVYRLGGGGGTLTVSSALTGANSLIISTNGTNAGNVTLTGNNTFTGGLTLNSGSLNVTADSQLGGVPGSFSAGNLTFGGTGGTLQFNASFNPNANRGITINSGATATVNTNTGISATMAQAITGSGNLVKSGTGTLVLSGTNTYTGTTTVNQNSGTLQFDSLAAIGGSGASVTVNSGSTVALNFDVQQSALNRFVSGSAGVIAFAGNGSNSNTLDFSASGANLTAASLGSTGTFTYSGTLTPNGTTYRLGGGGSTGVLTVTSGLTGANALTVGNNSTSANTVILSGTNTYTGATTVNQGTLRAGGANAFGANSAVTVSNSSVLDLAGFNTNIGSLAGSNTTAAVTLGSSSSLVLTMGGNNSSTSYSGNITGSGSLVKNGTGTQTLNGTGNTYSGATTINAGVLQFGALGSIGGSGASVTVNSGATAAAGYAIDQAFLNRINSSSTGVVALRANSANNLDFSSASGANLANVSLGATGTYTYSGTITPYSNTYRLGGGGGTLTVSGNLTGASSLIADSNGTTAATVILSGANTYTGATSLNAGVLQAGVANAFGTNSSVTIASGTTLDMNGFNTALGSLTGAGTLRFGTTTSSSPLTNVLTVGGNNTSTVFTGNMTVVGGTGGSVVKTGTGTLELQGTSAHTSGTTISQGTLKFNAAAGIGTGALTINSGGTAAVGYALDQTLLNRITSGSAGVVALAANSGNTLDFSASGANLPSLSLGATGSYTFSGNIVPYGTNYRFGGGGGTLTVSQPIADGEGGATGVIVDGNGTMPGTVVLGAINSYSGATTVNAGILQISSDANLGTVPATATPGNITLNGGTLQTSANVALSVNRGVQLGSAGGTIDTQTNNVTLPAIVAGSGSLTKTGAGTLTLSGVNTYTGGTTISAGTVSVSADSGMGAPPGSPTTNVTMNGGTLQWGNSFALNANRNISLGTGGTFDTNGFNGTIAGAVGGSGGFTKTGAGTLTLSGAYTGSGSITVNTGTLVMPSSASNSNLSVATNAALSAGGSIGALTLASGSTLAPQNSSGAAIGLLSASGATVADGSILNFDLGPNSTSDRLALSGLFGYNPSSSSLIIFAFDVPNFDANHSGDTFTLVTFNTNPVNASPADVAKFRAMPRGNLNTIQGYFTLTPAQSGQPGSLTYTMTGYAAIPEPGTLGLAGVGSLVLAIGCWRRKVVDRSE